ncbi:hypothetical protein NUU61_007358 [Penicillium alfredii]|uniref:Integral membrane protein n=1 Tax=Penicillium alfredii TaxID=1506179 RepID=A0A9W9K467_9EURO|nr:uncharacterized protein NUU61_007358 [Penicillium alfredii]KAJ5092488.1 hypothetical protein NUU61_007358 [Penicillium alfredii]
MINEGLIPVLLWSIQTQLLTQIIANRVALIMTSRRQARMLKWALAVPITIVNISVFCIWIPAHMDNATSAQINLNNIWERVEKAFFLIIDLGLNLIFLYLVRSRLISGGLTKYWRLYNFNAGIVVISTCMDVLLLGFLSLRNAYVYVQFAPVAYIIKLNIELTMAVLISKVVRSSCNNPPEDWYSSNHISDRYAHQATCTSNNDHRKFPPEVEMDTLHELDQESPKDLDHQRPGIMRTIVTTVQAGEDDASTEELVVNPKRMTR